MTYALHRPSGRTVLSADSLPALITLAQDRYGRTWLGLMASGWSYSLTATVAA